MDDRISAGKISRISREITRPSIYNAIAPSSTLQFIRVTTGSGDQIDNNVSTLIDSLIEVIRSPFVVQMLTIAGPHRRVEISLNINGGKLARGPIVSIHAEMGDEYGHSFRYRRSTS